jgi:hypothetical protein
MLTTYDRYMREYRAKLVKARLEREVPQAQETEVVPSVRVAQLIRQAHKDSVRGGESQ